MYTCFDGMRLEFKGLAVDAPPYIAVFSYGFVAYQAMILWGIPVLIPSSCGNTGAGVILNPRRQDGTHLEGQE